MATLSVAITCAAQVLEQYYETGVDEMKQATYGSSTGAPASDAPDMFDTTGPSQHQASGSDDEQRVPDGAVVLPMDVLESVARHGAQQPHDIKQQQGSANGQTQLDAVTSNPQQQAVQARGRIKTISDDDLKAIAQTLGKLHMGRCSLPATRNFAGACHNQ